MIWILLVILGVIVYFLYKDKKISFPNGRSPEDLLDERFVRGEIDENTYLKMKNVLKRR